MARKSLIAAPWLAARYHSKPDRFFTITMLMDNTQVLHYQGFAGHMSAQYYVRLRFSDEFRQGGF
jgi:hypothetical protein